MLNRFLEGCVGRSAQLLQRGASQLSREGFSVNFLEEDCQLSVVILARLWFPATKLARHWRVLLNVDGCKIPRAVAEAGVAIVWISPRLDAFLHNVFCRLQAGRIFALPELRLGVRLDGPASNNNVESAFMRQIIDLRFKICGSGGCGGGSGGDGFRGGGRRRSVVSLPSSTFWLG